MVDGGTDLQPPGFSLEGSVGLPGATIPNSGKSAIFTWKVTLSGCAVFNLSADIGADLVPPKPEGETHK